jgi:hypothetical protein
MVRRGSGVTQFKLTPLESTSKSGMLFGAYKDKITFSHDYDQADQEITEMFEDSTKKPL